MKQDEKRLLIVDGYNVIRATAPYREIAGRDDMESARSALISDVAGFVQGERRATVVFDGAGNPQSSGLPHDVCGVTVIFSPHRMTADSVIERLARTAREDGIEVEVVTSDAQTQWTVLGESVVRTSSSAFGTEISWDKDELREYGTRGQGRVPLADRLDAGLRARLERWARGED